MNDERDWYPTTLEVERTLYRNFDSKIDGYMTKYLFLKSGLCGADL